MNPARPATAEPINIAHLLRDAAALALAMAIAAVPIGLMAWSGHGSLGLVSVGVALAVCYGSVVASLLITYLLRDPTQALAALLLGMGIRAGGPMLFGIYMTQTEHRLAAVGLFGQIVLFYLVGLGVETLLRVGQLKRGAHADASAAGESPAARQTS